MCSRWVGWKSVRQNMNPRVMEKKFCKSFSSTKNNESRSRVDFFYINDKLGTRLELMNVVVIKSLRPHSRGCWVGRRVNPECRHRDVVGLLRQVKQKLWLRKEKIKFFNLGRFHFNYHFFSLSRRRLCWRKKCVFLFPSNLIFVAHDFLSNWRHLCY